jgi:hypothetical protein
MYRLEGVCIAAKNGIICEHKWHLLYLDCFRRNEASPRPVESANPRKGLGGRRKMRATSIYCWIGVLLVAIGLVRTCSAVEPGQYRLLSISTSSKMILVSQLPNKTKFLLDASTAKITVDGKPAEFQNLQAYTIIRVKFDARKSSKDGIEIDGVATEIKITIPDNKK